MKILIVEEALKTLHGHWFQYIRDIVDGGHEAGHDIKVAVHKDACPEILRAFPCLPVLSRSVFDRGIEARGKLAGIKRVLAHNLSLYRDLAAVLNSGDSYDLVLATTPRLDHLLAHELLYWRFRGRVRSWALIFIESVGVYSKDYSRISLPFGSIPLCLAMRITRLLPGRDQFLLLAESEGHVRQFKRFSGLTFNLVPHVTRLPMAKPDTSESAVTVGRPLVLSTFGFTRYDKGVDVLHAAIRQLRVSQVSPWCQFYIQWTGDYRLHDGTWVCKEGELESSRLVCYLPSFSSSAEYYDWLARTNIMVLPYRRNFYYDKLSRVAIDASLAGIPIIYPAGTWLESFVQKYAAGVAFQSEQPDSLAEAIRVACAEYIRLVARAKARMHAAKVAFSAETFFKCISLAGKL